MGICGSKEPPAEKVFGAILTRMEGTPEISSQSIPCIVLETSKYIREKGLASQGIFRRSANAVKLGQCKKMYNSGEPVDFDNLGGVHLAANALKAFFRDLRIPLLTNDAYSDILKISAMDEGPDKVSQSKDTIVKHLPAIHLILLRAIVYFIGEVSSMHEITGMSLENLSIVFGPNLLWPKGAGPNSGKVPALSDITLVHSFVEFLIRRRDDIFVGIEKDGYVEVTL